MPKLRAPALSLGLTATIALLAAPGAGAAQKKAAKAPAIAPVCQDFYAQANAGWLQANLPVAGSGQRSALAELAERAHQQQVDLLDGFMRDATEGVEAKK